MFDHIRFNKNAFETKASPSSDYILQGYTSSRIKFLVPIYISILIDDTDGGIDPVGAFDYSFEIVTNIGPLNFVGLSELVVSSMGDVQTSLIHLDNILLLPGEEITIDTDLLIVLFGQTHDVSSITADSEFFKFGPGINRLIFEPAYDRTPRPGPENELDVKILWQNRWL